MNKLPRSTANGMADKLREELADIATKARGLNFTTHDRRILKRDIGLVADHLNTFLSELDPVKGPKTVFDPGNPRTIGFFIAMALTAQSRQSLSQLGKLYGSGVYAIYYNGSFELYAPLRGTETPIYVGQAAPSIDHAQTAVEQGARLAARLDEHRNNIKRASVTLDIADFDYRSLVVQTGWETGAEDYLIRLFRPIWNRETNLVFGLGKHGDSSKTRRNKRSPWDTLHEGRAWAIDEEIADAKSPAKIAKELIAHFAAVPPFPSCKDVFEAFIASLNQT